MNLISRVLPTLNSRYFGHSSRRVWEYRVDDEKEVFLVTVDRRVHCAGGGGTNRMQLLLPRWRWDAHEPVRMGNPAFQPDSRYIKRIARGRNHENYRKARFVHGPSRYKLCYVWFFFTNLLKSKGYKNLKSYHVTLQIFDHFCHLKNCIIDNNIYFN